MGEYNLIILISVLFGMVGVGYILGLVGNAGGPIFMIIMLGLFQLPVKTAVGTGLLASMVTGFIAFIGHKRMKNIHYPFALLTGFFGALGASIGANVSLNIPDEMLKDILGVVIMSVAIIGLTKTLFNKKNSRTESAQDLGATINNAEPILNFQSRAKVISTTLGFSVGSACGILGLSGASPLSAFSRILLGYPMRICIGSAYLAATMTSFSGFAHYAIMGEIDIIIGLALSLGTGTGIYLSSKTIKIIADRPLTICVFIFTLLMAAFTFIV